MTETFSKRRLAKAWASHLRRLGAEGPPWGYELTGTFTGPTTDFAAGGTVRSLARYLARKKLGQHVQIMFTVEWTARGQPHVHGLIRLMDAAGKVNTRTIEAAWTYSHRTAGKARVHLYDAEDDYEGYMTKYGRDVHEAWACPSESGCRRRECLSPIWK